jgi:hypothetical protein
MKPLVVDFAPERPWPDVRHRLRWFAGGASALLVVVSSAVWLLVPPAEAGHMAANTTPRLPAADEAQAADAAVRALNFPWLSGLDALAGAFGPGGDAVLLRAEADVRRSIVRISGEARDAAAVQGLPSRLRALPGVAEATLLGQEAQDAGAAWPVRFSLELRLKDPA